MEYELVSTANLGNHATVTVIRDRGASKVWTLVSTDEGIDYLVGPDGVSYRDLELDSRFAPAELSRLMDFMVENV